MRFMNEWNIDDARDRYRDHQILGPATRTLVALVDAANANSDGWCYWPKPAHAAAKLMELIERDGTAQYLFNTEREDVTVAEYRKALAPIKAFRTRSGLKFEIYEASENPREALEHELADANKAYLKAEESVTRAHQTEREAWAEVARISAALSIL